MTVVRPECRVDSPLDNDALVVLSHAGQGMQPVFGPVRIYWRQIGHLLMDWIAIMAIEPFSAEQRSG
jgi:hypothetical protein